MDYRQAGVKQKQLEVMEEDARKSADSAVEVLIRGEMMLVVGLLLSRAAGRVVQD